MLYSVDQTITRDVSVRLSDPIVPGFNRQFEMDLTVHNVGQDLPIPTPLEPNFVFKLYVSDSPMFGAGSTEIDITNPRGFKMGKDEKKLMMPFPAGTSQTFMRVKVDVHNCFLSPCINDKV